MKLKIALIGAGSRDFGPSMVRDIILTENLFRFDIELVLMDIIPEHLIDIEAYSRKIADQLQRNISIISTTDLTIALKDSDYVISAIEVDRYKYWTIDFHIPRKYGFKQIYGENGGVGGIFHALRNIPPILHIAHKMEELCPNGMLVNFSNPEQKVIEAISRLSKINAVGLCHGVFIGIEQISALLNIKKEDLHVTSCGMNHFTFFQTITNKHTGEDLYPLLSSILKELDPLTNWHEIALGRVLFNLYGLWPSPGTNHYGEYIGWAQEFMASEMHWYYDPANGHPWETNKIPEAVYYIDQVNTHDRVITPEESISDKPLIHSGEVAIPIIEAISCDIKQEIPAIVTKNNGKMPQFPDDTVVELPAMASKNGLEPIQMEALPTALAEMMNRQGTINTLLVEAIIEKSKNKLLQVILLDPTVNSYRNAVMMLDEMLELQKNILPEFR